VGWEKVAGWSTKAQYLSNA